MSFKDNEGRVDVNVSEGATINVTPLMLKMIDEERSVVNATT